MLIAVFQSKIEASLRANRDNVPWSKIESVPSMIAVPAYPDFRTLEIDDLQVFKKALSQYQPEISEFTFTNLYSWRHVYKLQVANLRDFLLIRSDDKGKKRFFAPLGVGDPKPIMASISQDSPCLFIRIPERIKALFDTDPSFYIQLDRDNSDYLHLTADLIRLSGQRYDGKRNLIKNFKLHHNHEYVVIDSSNANRCLEFEDTWCGIKDCDSQEGLSNEHEAIKEMIHNFSMFDLIAGAISMQGKIVALAIAQELNKETLVMHVLKADPNMAGLNQLMNNEFISRQASSFKYVNMEQDLGVAGLRKAKLSYHPISMVNKYTIKKNVMEKY